MLYGVKLLLYVVLGGLGSMEGAIIAAFALFLLERALDQLQTVVVFGSAIGTWTQVIFAVLLVVIVIARPQGILGKRSV
jgi:branched-chain amino acid transport system permease protein